MKIKQKLLLGFGTILLLIVILLGILLNMLSQLDQNMYVIVKDRYERLRLANLIQHEVSNMNSGIRELLLDYTDTYNPEHLKFIEDSKKKAMEATNTLSAIVERPKSIQRVSLVEEKLEHYLEFNQRFTGLVKAGKVTEATNLLNEGKNHRLELYQAVDELTNYQHINMEQELMESHQIYNMMISMIISFAIALLITGVLVTYWVIRDITKSVKYVTEVMTNVSSKKHIDDLPRIEIITKDEIGDIAKAYNSMVQALEDRAIAEHELTQTIKEQYWLNEKIAELATMNQGIQEMEVLAQLFINKMTPMVGANYGVFYLKEDSDGKEQLKKIAAYAWNDSEVGEKDFQLGEGLVGQCALENNIIYLSKAPEDYLTIKSGLGQASPASIIVVPVEFEKQVLAVIELASFEFFNDLHQELLCQVLKNLGVTLNSLDRQKQIRKLLTESQTLTEELQSQSEELQLQQEELRSINEKLEEENKNSEQKTNELKKTKEVLEEKASQLILTSKYKSEFLANMSHELRTPLNSLLILAQMLVENKDNNLTSKQLEYANTIYSSGYDLLDLINDILELAKVESGKMEVTCGEVNISQVSKMLERQFSPVAKRKEIEFRIAIDKDLPEVFYTDEQRLQQILKNLLSNAFKFTEKGYVSLKFSKAVQETIREEELFNHANLILAIAVTDTGIGIPKEKQEDIFKAFRQGDGTTSRKYGGTGLGLSICKETAKLLGGYIRVSSEEGEGSTFTLYIPSKYDKLSDVNVTFKEEAATGLAEEPLIIDQENLVLNESKSHNKHQEYLKEKNQENVKLAGKTVLIVDDDMRNVFALTTALEREQMRVLVAENGREGIEVLQSNAGIDMVLMDIMMPEMDGYEAMSTIRQLPDFQQLPIIALTAKAMKIDRKKCIDAGASDYISKPVNLDQLYSLIRVWLHR